MANVVDPATCWELKHEGFEQPTPAAGQYWFNLLDYPFQILSVGYGELSAKNLWTGKISPFDGIASEGMVYSPTEDEYNEFKRNQFLKNAVN